MPIAISTGMAVADDRLVRTNRSARARGNSRPKGSSSSSRRNIASPVDQADKGPVNCIRPGSGGGRPPVYDGAESTWEVRRGCARGVDLEVVDPVGVDEPELLARVAAPSVAAHGLPPL